MTRRLSDVVTIVALLLLVAALGAWVHVRCSGEKRWSFGQDWLVVARDATVVLTDEPRACVARARLLEERDRLAAEFRRRRYPIKGNLRILQSLPGYTELEAASAKVYEGLDAARPVRYALRLDGLSAALLGVLTARAAGEWIVRVRECGLRRRRGHCLSCGYDLRMTPDRCPECGSIGP